MRLEYKIRYFPFCPGIPWNCENGKYVMPEMDTDTWLSAIQDRDVVVVAHGGLLESFYSLSICEAINIIKPGKRVFWSGNEQFHDLISMQGLANIFEFELKKEKVEKYPVPLFFDRDNRVYFNCLNNYIIRKSCLKNSRKYSQKSNKNIILKQICDNLLVEWDIRYLPKFRSANDTDVIKWKKQENLHLNQSYIAFFPEGVSDISCLGWSMQKIKEFLVLMKQLDISVILFSNNHDKYYSSDGLFYKAPLNNINLLINLLLDSRVVISESVDYILLAFALAPKATIMSRQPVQKQYDLYRNAEFIQAENIISIGESGGISPMEIFRELGEA